MGIIGFLIAGLIIGALARLIKPGKQDLSVPMTLLLGVFEGMASRRSHT